MKRNRVFLFASLVYILYLLMTITYNCCDGLHRSKTEAGLARSDQTELLRPQEETVLAEPVPRPCKGKEINLVVAVISAPQNYRARSVIR